MALARVDRRRRRSRSAERKRMRSPEAARSFRVGLSGTRRTSSQHDEFNDFISNCAAAATTSKRASNARARSIIAARNVASLAEAT